MRQGTIAVRLEGGIGDHILGMRLLYFIRKRYPCHKIICYSDAGGAAAQLDVARMSPLVSEAIPVYHRKRHPKVITWGRPENIDKKYLDMMNSADLAFDAWGETFFIQQSKALGVPFYRILGHRPELAVPGEFKERAKRILGRYKGRVFVGMDVSKYGLYFLRKNKGVVFRFIRRLLKNPRVTILNFYTSTYRFPHWPKALSASREEAHDRESLKIGQLWNIDRRVVPMVDLPVLTVAALLERCRYFIGVENGIRYMAWALGVPYMFFIMPETPNVYRYMRWYQDFHRSLSFDCSKEELSKRLSEVSQAVEEPRSRRFKIPA